MIKVIINGRDMDQDVLRFPATAEGYARALAAEKEHEVRPSVVSVKITGVPKNL